MPTRTLSNLIRIAAFGLVLTQIFYSFGDTLSGDITGDGAVNGRDALKVMRASLGLETVAEEEIPLGDVWPIPGLNGRRIGDGKLTREDAELILQQSVGLLPDGTFSGNYSRSVPVIDDFFPRCGSVGTSVTLEGQNFLGGLPDENLIFFGGVPATIRAISGTRITTEVPAGAETGLIRVWTPGGAAESDGNFYVTKPSQGKLVLGQGLNPGDFTIVSAYGESPVNADGSFTTPAVIDAMTILGAASSSETNNTYLALLLSGTAPSTTGIVIDSLSTAKTLVFMNPFFMTRDPADAKTLFDLMDPLPEIKQLASVIDQRYPAGADGLEDEPVRDAWNQAVAALTNALPDRLTVTLEETSGNKALSFSNEANERRSSMLSAGSSLPIVSVMANDGVEKPVKIYGVDRDYLKASYSSEDRSLKMKLDNGYSPVDWLVVLFQVDPESMPLGVNTPFTEIRSTGLKHTGYKVTNFVAANQWTSNINVLKRGLDYGMDWIKVNEPLKLLPDDGVYELRMFSGALRDYQGWDFSGIKTTEDGLYLAFSSTVTNMALVMVDVWKLVKGDDKTFVEKALRNGQKYGLAAASQENLGAIFTPGISAKRIMQILLDVLVEVGKGMALTSITTGLSATEKSLEEKMAKEVSKAEKKLLGTLKNTIANANGFLKILSKISTFGKIIERIAGLAGYLLNPKEMEISPGPTPLETMLVVVGDPFGPILTDFSPKRGAEGSEVTITGERFSPNPKDNHVYFGDQQGEVVSGDNTHIVVKVPKALQGTASDRKVTLSIETAASIQLYSFSEKFMIVRAPNVTSIEPTWGFAPNPNSPSQFPSFTGTSVVIFGERLNSLVGADPYKLSFGEIDTKIDRSTEYSITFTVPPNAKPGDHEVVLDDPQSQTSTKPVLFRVVGPPIIYDVTPEAAKAGQMIEISGKELTGSNIYVKERSIEPFYKSDDCIRFLLPALYEEGETLTVFAANPAGKSDEKTIQAIPGVEVPPLPELPLGYYLFITTNEMGIKQDGKLSLDEITQFLNKEFDLTKFDDQNRKTMKVWTEEKDENGYVITVFVTEFEDTPAKTTNGAAEHETHEIWTRIHQLNGTVSEYMSQTIDLDATEDQMEEADFLKFSGSDPSAYDPKLFKNAIETRIKEQIDSIGFRLTPQTVLSLPSTPLGVEGSISLADGCVVTFNRVAMRETLKINANNVTIKSGTFSSASADAIQLNGFGNIIGLESDEKQSIWVLYSGGDGIVCNGGGKNIIRADIRECPGVGLRSQNSKQNTYKFIAVENCVKGGISATAEQDSTWDYIHVRGGGFGVLLDQCKGNILTTGLSVENCLGTGLTVQGGFFNMIGTSYNLYTSILSIKKCGQMGVFLYETENNFLNNLQIEGCQGNALQLGPNATANTLMGTSLTDSENGLVLTGENTLGNIIINLYAGGQYSLKTKWTLKGNRGSGVVIQNGANNNQFSNLISMANGEHGILIEGENTHTNRIEDGGVGCVFRNMLYSAMSSFVGNGGDGILIRSGAHHNTILRTDILGCGGNGVTIQDEGSNENAIQECTSGSDAIDYNITQALKPNRGYGIVVQNKASGTILSDNTLGANFLGSILIDESRPLAQDRSYSTLIENNNTHIESAASALIFSDTEFAQQERTALHITNSSRVQVTNCSLGISTKGLIIDGENSGEHSISDCVITGASLCIRVEKSTDDEIINAIAANSKGNGIELIQTKNTLIGNAYVASNSNLPLLIDRCNDVSIISAVFSALNKTNGVRVIQSENIFLQAIRIVEVSEAGLLLQESKNIDLDRISIGYAEAGILADRCENLTLAGYPIVLNDPNQYNKAIMTRGVGIHLLNTKNVNIGSLNSYIRLINNAKQGILIQGDETKNVYVSGCLIFQNSEEGIRVEGGNFINIGTSKDPNPNYIYGNKKEGILAQGDTTTVILRNNVIGLTETSGISNNQGNGIVLQGGIHDVLIAGNNISYNNLNGISITEGSHHNCIGFNTIFHNTLNGILIDGAASLYNQITRNLITTNYQSGIKLQGGNNNIEAPTVEVMEDQVNNLIGRIDAPDGSLVEIFADPYDEGEQLIATASVRFKNFSTSGVVPKGYKVHATITHPDGNTSEFGSSIVNSKRSSESQTYVFSSDSSGQKKIYIKRPSQEIPLQLTNDPSVDEDPQLSSQGRYITFTSDRGGNRDIWLMSNSGQNVTQVTSNSAPDYQPAWQPGGDKVLFVSERDGNAEIYQAIVNPDAVQGEVGYGEKTLDTTKAGYSSKAAGDAAAVRFTTMAGLLSHFLIYITADPVPFEWKVISFENKPGNTVIAEGKADPVQVGWNIVETGKVAIPENYLIAVYFPEANKPKIGLSYGGSTNYWWTYTAQTSLWKLNSYIPFMIRAFVVPPDPIRITNNNAADIEPAWSPDRTQIVFTSTRGGNTDLWIANVDGSSPKQLTDGKGKNTKAAWSPDGKSIAFVSDRDGNLELYSILVDGTGLQRLTNHAGIDTDPAWNKTGTRLFFSSNRESGMEIYSLAMNTLQASRLTISTGNSMEPHASPASLGTPIAALSIEEENPIVKTPSPDRIRPYTFPAQLIVSSGKAKTGESVSIEVSLEGAENIGNLAFDLQYDSAWLSLADIPAQSLSVNPLFALNPETFPSVNGVVRFNSVYASGLSGAQSVMKLYFDIDRNAQVDQSTIAVQNLQGCDILYADVPLTAQDGIVTIIRDITGVQSWMLY